MEGVININGTIGEDLHLADVISQVAQQPDATAFIVNINSVGGVVDVGFDIYNYLKSLNVPITTIGNEIVASIATVIFMAGNVRKLSQGCEFMIHLPSGSVSGTAEEIDNYNSFLKGIEKKLVNFYVDATGLNETAIRPLLNYETWLSQNLAFDFKFITEKTNETKILAMYNFKNENMNVSKEDKSWLDAKFEAITNLFKSTIKNVVVQDANGVEIDFVDVAEGEQPIIGTSTATVDGQPAEGEYIMPDGQTFVFVAGVLTEVKPAETDASAERIVELEKQLADALSINAKFEKDFKAFKSEIKSKFIVEKEEVKKEVVEESPYAKMLEKIKNKR